MEKKRYIFGLFVFFAAFLLLQLMPSSNALPTKKQLSFNLYNHRPVLTIYTKDSDYEPMILEAVEDYNKIEPIFLVTQDKEKADIICYDYNKKSMNIGITYANGKMGFNKRLINKVPFQTRRQRIYSVALHELGHALGIKHNQSIKSIMFPHATSTMMFSEYDIERIHEVYQTMAKDMTISHGISSILFGRQ